MSSSASSAIDEATGKLVALTLQYASTSIQSQMDGIVQGTTLVADNPMIANFIQREVYNYGGNPDINLFFTRFNSIYHYGTACYQRENATGLMTQPTPPGFLNLTYIVSFIPDSTCWIDYNRTGSVCAKIDPVTGRSGTPYKNNIVDFGDPALTRTNSLATTMNNCPGTGSWSADLIYNEAWLAYATCPTLRSGKPSPYMCLTAYKQNASFFAYTSPTANSRVFLLANEDKLILANQNITVANATNNGLVAVDKAQDPIIAELGAKLMATYGGGISKFPQFSSNQIQNYRSTKEIMNSFSLTSDKGAEWVTAVLKMSFGAGTPAEIFALVVSMPRSQFTGDVERSTKTGVIITAILAVIGCILGVLATYGATRPLKKISENMAKATNFDFTMIENGKFDESNVFTEIRNLQRTFNTMIKAFAVGIKNSRALNGMRQNSGQNSGSGEQQPAVNQIPTTLNSYDYGYGNKNRNYDSNVTAYTASGPL
ncbi:hypothetical protein HK098_005235, partial [Nowakowskiella sp. JEL0407]